MPSVSVIIPTYTHRNFVLQSLDSVFRQTFTDYEVIVVNDGSPDDTELILHPLVQAGRIRYLRQANRGQAHARNHGIELARSEYIALLDDDDLWPPDKLAWQVNVLRSNPAIGAVAGTAKVGAQFSSDGAGTAERCIRFESIFDGNPIVSPGQTLIRTQLLREIGGFDERIWGADDLDLWLRLSRRSTLVMHNRLALEYRLHQGNASRHVTPMLTNILRVFETHLRDIGSRQRKQWRTRAYRWAYAHVGWRVAGELKSSLRQHDIDGALRAASALSTLARGLGPDRPALLKMLGDLLPARWRGAAM